MSLDLAKSLHTLVSQKEFQEGRINAAAAEKLFALATEESEVSTSQEGSQLTDNENELDNLSVIVAPILATNKQQRGRNSTILPLLVPAQLSREGRLWVGTSNDLPWIPRTLLEPTASNLVLGTLDSCDQFYGKNLPDIEEYEPEKQWINHVRYAEQLLESVTHGNALAILRAGGNVVADQAAVIVTESFQGIARNILRVYGELGTEPEIPALLKEILEGPQGTAKPLSAQEWIETAALHTGSIGNTFALSTSQREALHYLLKLPTGRALAVSGPPGTGKTTLLQSVIASLWINSAIAQRQPPVITATSTNNQAVMNVIDSFSNIDQVERWLPVNSFGLFLVNVADKRKDAEERGILCVNKFGQGFPAEAESRKFVNRAQHQYLERCSTFFKYNVAYVDDAIRRLHNELESRFELQRTGLLVASKLVELSPKLQALEKEYKDAYKLYTLTEAEVLQATAELARCQELRKNWHRHCDSEPFYYGLLQFLPFIRRKRALRNQMFLDEYMPSVVIESTHDEVSSLLLSYILEAGDTLASLRVRLKQTKTDLDTCSQNLDECRQMFQTAQTQWLHWCEEANVRLHWEELLRLERDDGEANQASLLNWLDTHFRHDMFVLATHYWEGRWLKEVRGCRWIWSGGQEGRNRESQIRKWQRYAMLTPCLVTTMHSGPSFFTYFERALHKSFFFFDFIDLLIVDEAGQISPEVSGAMLALARKLFAVGDELQIEPVWNIPIAVDIGNLRRFKLAENESDIEHCEEKGITASKGSFMKMIRGVNYFETSSINSAAPSTSLMLTEHRRCVPQIIGYCNELAYQGLLKPLRPEITSHPWPHMGYAHVKGESAIERGSRQNLREAEAIVTWIMTNRSALEQHYNAELDHILGIITPFVAQKRTIISLLMKEGIHISKVGTVHALQGGERPVILFSTVYTTRDQGTFFFDRGPNMLNVAVSRAKDSFLVFGDMEILNPQLSTPSGLLARFLFNGDGQEIIDIDLPQRLVDLKDQQDIHTIRSFQSHISALYRAFDRANEQLLIISPEIRDEAVEAIGICDLVTAAISRGVKVRIFVDHGINKNLRHESAYTFAQELHKRGASIFICQNIHSKIICIDQDIFIEGSFGWLSVPKESMKQEGNQISIIYMGEKAQDFINETQEIVQQRVLKEFTPFDMTE